MRTRMRIASCLSSAHASITFTSWLASGLTQPSPPPPPLPFIFRPRPVASLKRRGRKQPNPSSVSTAGKQHTLRIHTQKKNARKRSGGSALSFLMPEPVRMSSISVSWRRGTGGAQRPSLEYTPSRSMSIRPDAASREYSWGPPKGPRSRSRPGSSSPLSTTPTSSTAREVTGCRSTTLFPRQGQPSRRAQTHRQTFRSLFLLPPSPPLSASPKRPSPLYDSDARVHVRTACVRWFTLTPTDQPHHPAVRRPSLGRAHAGCPLFAPRLPLQVLVVPAAAVGQAFDEVVQGLSPGEARRGARAAARRRQADVSTQQGTRTQQNTAPPGCCAAGCVRRSRAITSSLEASPPIHPPNPEPHPTERTQCSATTCTRGKNENAK